jgi:tRNA(fMet)-specific endonuclease VapC
VLNLDETSTQLFGEIKAFLERQGRRLDDADLLIGSIAIDRDAVVVTGNRRHYERMPDLRIENWMEY